MQWKRNNTLEFNSKLLVTKMMPLSVDIWIEYEWQYKIEIIPKPFKWADIQHSK